MWLDAVNGIPIVGHTKGLVHYLGGDVEGGNKAMKQSTRTSVVMGAGAVGSIAGPGGAIALGTATGALWDTVESVVTDEPTGVIAGVKNIGDSVAKGEVPYNGVLQTTLCLGGDAVGACGGASLVSSLSQSAGQSVATTAGKSIGQSAGKTMAKEAMTATIVGEADVVVVTVTHCMARDTAEKAPSFSSKPPPRSIASSIGDIYGVSPPEEPSKPPPPKPQQDRSSGPTSGGNGQQPPRRNPSNTNKPPPSKPPPPKPQQDRSTGPTSGGNGQQPPRRNPSNTNEPPQQEQMESFWQEFLDIFEVGSLDDISIRGRHIFKSLEKSQKSYLKKILKHLIKKGILKKAMETLKNIFNTKDLEDVTFVNFLSLVEIIIFVDIFEAESLDDISIRGRHIFKPLKKNQKKYLKKILKNLIKEDILEKVMETLKNIFHTVDLEDVTFVNFLSLVEIILQYIGERAARINQRERERQEFSDSYDERRTESIRIACNEILVHDYTIVRVFKAIKDKIESQALPINFRDIFAAVYHYFKHRHVGQVELSVQEYYNLLRSNLEIIVTTKEYKELKNGGKIEFEIYYTVYKTRFRIVITKMDDCVILCTGFFLDDYDGTDEDLDKYINGRSF